MRLSLLLCSLVWTAACTAKKPLAPGSPVDLVARGKAVYQSNCTACHASDPSAAGPVGPEIAKSSLELIQSRVMKAEYPSGYQPKRKSKLMAALPQLKDDIPALHAYLNSL